MRITDARTLEEARQAGMARYVPDAPRIAVGMDTCGIGSDADKVFDAFTRGLRKAGIATIVARTGCFGFCSEEPLVNVQLPERPLIMLHKVRPEDAAAVIDGISRGELPLDKALCRIEEWDHLTGQVRFGRGLACVPLWNELPFFRPQKKIVLRDSGLIDPQDIGEYIAAGGYGALHKAVTAMTPRQVIGEVAASKLRGRGGVGFPTGRKWELMAERSHPSGKKYVICNGDEGDPGAYMNRNEIESDPHMVLEGMLIGGYAMGADEGVIYIRAEYPVAVQRMKLAVRQAEQAGLLGKAIFGSGFSFTVTIVEGAGAFVCGEETALIASIEGRAGRPRVRPPFPAEQGLYGKPTDINNVETWCNIAPIIIRGAEWFRSTGTAASAGTKVFSLVGKIKNTGLVELPLGKTLDTIVYDIGEGSGSGKPVRAVQTGGPSGGCVPADRFATTVDYESLNALGTIMGSGGIVVMDSDNCMVDVAKYFTQFTASESCGTCTPCREGLAQAMAILERITEGSASEEDLERLRELAETIRDTALCGLGQTSTNPVLTTLDYFRKEYDRHIKEHRCDAGVCRMKERG